MTVSEPAAEASAAPNVVDSVFTKLRAVVTSELLKVAPPVIAVPALV